MPNGGSDNCGTCCHNSANKGQTGYPRTPPSEKTAKCLIRDIDIANPFWTYCVNHPYKNEFDIRIPIGAVYGGMTQKGVTEKGDRWIQYERAVLLLPPDTIEMREKLLELLNTYIEEVGRPSLFAFIEEVVKQLGRYGERNAVEGIRRLINLDLSDILQEEYYPRFKKISIIAVAIEALSKILGDNALPEINYGLNCGLEALKSRSNYDEKEDELKRIRFYSVVSLVYCNSKEAIDYLEKALKDPSREIVELAGEILEDKRKDN